MMAVGPGVVGRAATGWARGTAIDASATSVRSGSTPRCPVAPESPTAGYSRVGVLPTHTRQGLLTQMMQRSLREARERGQVLASLRASEAPIYGRFGYGLAGDFVAAHITSARDPTTAGRAGHRIDATAPARRGARRRTAAVRACRPSVGRHDRSPGVDVEALPEGGDRAGVDAVRQGRVRRRAHRHRRRRRRLRALRDRVVGGVRRSPFTGSGTVHDLWGASDAVELALWQYLFDIDLVTTWRASERPVNDPIRRALYDVRAYETREVVRRAVAPAPRRRRRAHRPHLRSVLRRPSRSR